MTVVHSGTPVAARDVDAATAELRLRGLRVSSARRLVLAALYSAPGPISADQIAGGLGGRLPRSDLASVYRNLETLERVGLVRHVHLGHGPGLYGLAAAAEREFVTCERCGSARAFDPAELAEARVAIRRATGFTARFSHFPIVGVCARCSRADGTTRRAA